MPGVGSPLPAADPLVSTELEQQAIAWWRHLHAHPELSFQEVETTAFIEKTLRSFGGFEIDRPTPTGLVGRLRGPGTGRVLALRADIDALAIREETGLSFASTRDGVMHACGHDAHAAILLAAARALTERRNELAGEVRFLFQHAEEVPPGGARQLVDAGILDDVDLVVGIHLFSHEPVGIVSAVAGPRTAFADTFAIEIRGKGGHAAMPHDARDPVVVAAQVVTNLQQIVSRTIDPFQGAVISVTQFHAGTADNVIPQTVELRGTLRAFDVDVRTTMRACIERILGGVTAAHGTEYELVYTDGYPPVVNDPEAAAFVEGVARAELGDDLIRTTPPVMGAEDFSAYLEKAPGVFFIVGAGGRDRPPHHHPRFAIDEAAIRPGIAVFVRTALEYLRP